MTFVWRHARLLLCGATFAVAGRGSRPGAGGVSLAPSVAHFVAPSGSMTGDGTAARPWDLATALAGGAGGVHPGDTIWIRGGIYRGDYRSTLRGLATHPIVVRQARGERVIVVGRINAYGSFTSFWGLEITQSDPSATHLRGIDVRGPGHRFINLVVHDVGGTGIGFWMEGVNAEVYGCIVYNNGNESSLHHGIYVINREGEKRLTDNVVFNNFAYGVHVFGKQGQALRGITIEGNIAFGNGSISPRDRAKPNLLVGGEGIAADDVSVAHNVFFFDDSVHATNVRLGYDRGIRNGRLAFVDNLVAGGVPPLDVLDWESPRIDRNTLLRRDSVDTARKEEPFVIVRPNAYERGRAHVAVLNRSRRSSVDVDLSAVLRAGDRYEIRSVQALFGRPVTSGVYRGGTVSIPMQAIPSPAPLAPGTVAPRPTGPVFDAFLVTHAP